MIVLYECGLEECESKMKYKNEGHSYTQKLFFSLFADILGKSIYSTSFERDILGISTYRIFFLQVHPQLTKYESRRKKKNDWRNDAWKILSECCRGNTSDGISVSTQLYEKV
jgi:hypothetical protein